MPWWTVAPERQVCHLRDADPEQVARAFDPLPPGAPAVLGFRPPRSAAPHAHVALLLDQLDRVALSLFPHWLPGGDRLTGAHDLGIAAVRTLAAEAASTSAGFRPFLTDLAERGLRAWPTSPVPRTLRRARAFPAEVRAAGLARVVVTAYGRKSLAVLVHLPQELSPADEADLVAAAEWLAHHGRMGVWLAGPAPRHVDRVRSVPMRVPGGSARPAGVVVPGNPVVPVDPVVPGGVAAPGVAALGGAVPAAAALGVAGLPALNCPPLAGFPRRDSAAEQALERALAPHPWAHGRAWNQTFDRGPLGLPYRLDLCWLGARLAVEVDGPEHRGRERYAADRERDNHLQEQGYDILRFTNEQVLRDPAAVVATIRTLLLTRRAPSITDNEMRHHVAG